MVLAADLNNDALTVQISGEHYSAPWDYVSIRSDYHLAELIGCTICGGQKANTRLLRKIRHTANRGCEVQCTSNS